MWRGWASISHSCIPTPPQHNDSLSPSHPGAHLHERLALQRCEAAQEPVQQVAALAREAPQEGLQLLQDRARARVGLVRRAGGAEVHERLVEVEGEEWFV